MTTRTTRIAPSASYDVLYGSDCVFETLSPARVKYGKAFGTTDTRIRATGPNRHQEAISLYGKIITEGSFPRAMQGKANVSFFAV
jgi:hypothetical protein